MPPQENEETNTPKIEEIPSSENQPETDMPSEQSGMEDTPPETPKPVIGGGQPKKKKLLLIALIAILLAGAVTAAYVLTREDSLQPTNQTSEQVKKDITLLRYGAGEGDLSQFAPTMDSNDGVFFVNHQMFNALVRFEEKTKIVPDLAAKWENPDNETWLFTLRDNVKFHNGNALKAKDVVYSFNQYKKNESFASLITPTVKSIEAVGDKRVKIVTNGVDPILLNRLANMFIVDSSSAGKVGPEYGTGPFTLKAGTKPTATHIELVAFDDYYGGHVGVRELHVTVYLEGENDKPGSAEAKMVDDLKAGKLDIVGFVSAENAEKAKSLGLSLYTADDISVYQLALGTKIKGSPVQSVKVRQAIHQSVDPEALMKALGREGDAASQLVPQFIPGYDTSIVRPKRDPAHAKQLLKEAGYPNGVNLTLTVFTAARDAGEEIARQLKEGGINVTLVAESDVEKLLNQSDAGTMEMFYYSMGSDFGDAGDVFAATVQNNNYSSPTIDSLMREANSTFDPEKRLETLKEVSRAAMKDVAIVPLYINQPVWVMTKPFVITQDTMGSDLGAYLYKAYILE